MRIRTAVFDACVLYGNLSRDLLLSLAVTRSRSVDPEDRILYRPKLTRRIHDEWAGSLRARRPDLDVRKLDRVLDQIVENIPDVLIIDYEPLEPTLTLPDPDDRHVLAAAIYGGADTIVTANLDDFPADALAAYGIQATHPDAFAAGLIDESPDLACELIRAMRARWTKPPRTAELMADAYRHIGFTQTAAAMAANLGRI